MHNREPFFCLCCSQTRKTWIFAWLKAASKQFVYKDTNNDNVIRIWKVPLDNGQLVSCSSYTDYCDYYLDSLVCWPFTYTTDPVYLDCTVFNRFRAPIILVYL